MTWIPFAENSVRLCNERIKEEDGRRQERAARELLRRLAARPGVILADEVGMGKTFVALAVAASTILARGESSMVVVMVPSSLKEKWPRDWNIFQENCLFGDAAKRIRARNAQSGLDFLRLLDDPVESRANLIFLTHGALSRALTDSYARLAVIKRAFKRRSSLAAQRQAFTRFAGEILYLKYAETRAPGIFEKLMDQPSTRWQGILRDAKLPFNVQVDDHRDMEDDPVPRDLQLALDKMGSDHFLPLVESLRNLPLRKSDNLKTRLGEVRGKLSSLMEEVWKEALRQVEFHSPLLILDEAHHVKNPSTRLASLFIDEEAARESKLVESSGPLGARFERMLFLTATPFQLGHQELVNVVRRFEGVDWKAGARPSETREAFKQEIVDLEKALDAAQSEAVRFDRVWQRLDAEIVGGDDEKVGTWLERESRSAEPGVAHEVTAHLEATKQAMKRAEEALRPWVLRHLKAPHLLGSPEIARRRILPGAAIRDEDRRGDGGLDIGADVLLPFLLAGRAQGILAASTKGRALFAEGLASSFEAYRETRTGVAAVDDDDAIVVTDDDVQVRWYLEQLDRALPNENPAAWSSHPKIQATAERVAALWAAGEKVLVFCHYRATGRALRRHITQRLREEIIRLGAARLPPGTAPDRVEEELELIGKRFFDTDGPIRRQVRQSLEKIIAQYPKLKSDDTKVVEVCRRFIRTPAFLVRYVDLGRPELETAFAEALEREDVGGLSLRRRIESFVAFLAGCEASERTEYLDALESIQTGTHVGRETADLYDEAEIGRGRDRITLLPNVRLANGEVRAETRRRLLLTFNTPLFPEVLVASSVLSEGVDLHRHCRHIIHHDLCWNPSTLEQRTGRVDRIASMAEAVRKPIHVYLPYVAATQDEKMYRVVRDRDRWFQIVLGEKYEIDEGATDRRANRVPLPKSIAESLTMNLHADAESLPAAAAAAEVPEPGTGGLLPRPIPPQP